MLIVLLSAGRGQRQPQLRQERRRASAGLHRPPDQRRALSGRRLLFTQSGGKGETSSLSSRTRHKILENCALKTRNHHFWSIWSKLIENFTNCGG